ncbi:MAG TPA: ORF6N domain-containing protein [Bacteroidales bacterium]|mgnify:CR=1 FL=1|nr:ORF6N domain-containing protein [Bacteroidales bacterium]HRX98311.1 ORF6N domain-containing protein [Bacteroidales bacterium]
MNVSPKDNNIAIAEEIIVSKIFRIRGKQVMLSHDLAELYQVETRVLNQQVKRNTGKFPERYMFQLTTKEYKLLRSQNVTLKRGQHVKYMPYAFTEHGILMLSSVLHSDRADKVNMLIIDTFVKLRELMFMHKDINNQLEQVQSKLVEHDNQFMMIFEYLKQLEKTKQEELEYKNRKRIGYKRKEEE